MDMTGFSVNLQQQPNEGSFFSKPQASNNSNNNSNNYPGGLSSSKTINESTSDFYLQEFNEPDFALGISESTIGENLMVGAHEPSAWQENGLIVDDSTVTCAFPCKGNERPSQGLSLSLCSSNSSSIGLQFFELGHTSIDNPQNPQNQHEEMRFMDSSSRDGGFFGKSPASIPHHQKQILHHHRQSQLGSCKYLGAAQELLMEFCSLGTKQMDAPKPGPHKPKQWEDESGSGTGSSSGEQSLCSLKFMELHRRKIKLLSMLDEVERRYKLYCDQMKAVLSSFETVAGDGAASVYSALASKAMSRHFRCLKDGIVAQIHATKKAMEEKDPVAPGTSEGETPRLRTSEVETPGLRILGQALRQQRAFQQMSTMKSHPWRPQRGLPERSVSVLRAWLFEHFLHPYPSDVDKHILARNTGLSRSQVSNWFINARVRLWKPMMEEMYMEETEDPDIINRASSNGDFDDSIGWPNQNPSSPDQKPTPDHLAQIDSECLSSIISNPDKNDSINEVCSKAFQSHHLLHGHQGFGAFGAKELDFSSYDHHAPGRASCANHDQSGTSNWNFNRRGGIVSLTLGLQQNGVRGVGLAFSPASQSSLFFSRDHVEDCHQVQYSLLDGEGQNLPYRNLMDHETVEDPGEIDCMPQREASGKDDNWDPGENVQAYIRKAEAPRSSEEDLINSPGLNDRMSNKWDFELTDPIRGSTGKLLMQLVENAIDLFCDACPSRSLSLYFRAEILLVLNVTRYNDAQLWMGQQHLVSLKQVDLSYSSLIMLPDLSKASNLWSLNLQGCINLVEVSSIQFLINLEYLNLNGCKSLRSLPSMMALKLLCSLHLSGCSKIRRLPLSIGCLSGLIVLDIRNCKRLQNLPISTSRLKSIQNLNISGCSNLMKHLSGSGMEKATQSVMGSSLFMSESIINPGSYISSNSSSDDISVRPQNNEILCPSRTPEEGKSSEVKVLEDPLSVTAANPLGKTEGIEEFPLAESSESLNQLLVQHCQKRCLESLMEDSSYTANFEEMPLVRRRISSESEPPSSSTTTEKESTELEGGIKPSSVFLEPSLARNETRRSKGLVQTSHWENLQSDEQENRAKEMVLPRPLAIKSSNECAAYLNYGFSQQRKALESYMAMPVEAIHEADAYEDIGRILDVMIQQTPDLHKRTNLEDIMSFLEELNENIPDTVTCLKSSRTHRTLLQLKLTCLDISLVEGQEQYTSLEAKLATISEEEAKLEAEIQLLMAKKEELSKEHQTTPN